MDNVENVTAEDVVLSGEKVDSKAIARDLNIDPKRFRSWLRSYLDSRGLSHLKPGQGGRYEFPVEMVQKIKDAYADTRRSGKTSVIIFDLENETISESSETE